MKTVMNKFFICLTFISTIAFTNCNDANEQILEAPVAELTIQEKVAVLETGEWLLKGFEDRVMHTFVAGKKHTFYGIDNVFSDTAIPGTLDYTITGEQLTIDYHFGNVSTYQLKFSCDNTIVEFFIDGELNTTLYKKGSNYQQCI